MGRKKLESFRYLRQCRDCGGLFKSGSSKAKFCISCMKKHTSYFYYPSNYVEQEIIELGITLEETEEVEEGELEFGRS